MNKLIFLTNFLLLCSIVNAQNITPENYIDMYKTIAISEMKRSGIPASITLSQGILETQSGNSDLVKRSNNHFGIKCKKSWTGESVKHTDDALNECFRKYSGAEDSFKDHSDYLKATARYAALFQLEASDYKGWAHGLKKAGYATNPRYPQILISNIEKYNLQKYDQDATDETGDLAATMQAEFPLQISVEEALEGKTNLNGLKSIFIVKGTSTGAIAAKANMPLTKLLEYNDLSSAGVVNEDQWLYFEPKAKEGKREYYTAMQKQSLYEISQINGVQLNSLMQYNGMKGTQTVRRGDKIRLRPASQLSFSN